MKEVIILSMKKYRDSLLLGMVLIGTIFVLYTLNYFMNPPQCPESYTQEQINSSNCIVGANIGLPIFLIAVAGTLLLAAHLALKLTEKNKR